MRLSQSLLYYSANHSDLETFKAELPELYLHSAFMSFSLRNSNVKFRSDNQTDITSLVSEARDTIDRAAPIGQLSQGTFNSLLRAVDSTLTRNGVMMQHDALTEYRKLCSSSEAYDIDQRVRKCLRKLLHAFRRG